MAGNRVLPGMVPAAHCEFKSNYITRQDTWTQLFLSPLPHLSAPLRLCAPMQVTVATSLAISRASSVTALPYCSARYSPTQLSRRTSVPLLV